MLGHPGPQSPEKPLGVVPTNVTLGIGGSVVGSPTYDIVTNTLYVGSDEGVIYAVRFPLP